MDDMDRLLRADRLSTIKAGATLCVVILVMYMLLYGLLRLLMMILGDIAHG